MPSWGRWIVWSRRHDGDQVVLTYSGHGRRIENPDSHEPDRMDETFVPADSGSGFFPIAISATMSFWLASWP